MASPTRALPVMYSRSVVSSARFYQSLGFEATFRLPAEGEPGYVSLRRGDAELAIVDAQWPRDQLGPDTGDLPRFEMFVYVDAAAARLTESLLKAAQDMPWGERIAYVRDPDGNPVALAAPTSQVSR